MPSKIKKDNSKNKNFSESDYFYLLDKANDLIQSVDAQGRYVYVNKKWRAILGYTKKEVENLTFKDVIKKEELSHCVKIFNQLKKGKSFYNIRTVFKNKKNKDIIVEGSLNVYRNKNNNFFTIGVFRDISEKTKKEEKEKNLKNEFKRIVELSNDWIWEVDKNGKYTHVEGNYKKILGYKEDEIIGSSHFDFMKEEEALRTKKIFKKMISNKETIRNLENWNLNKKGEDICLLTNAFPILDDKGNLLGYQGTDQDITENKKIEKELKDKEKMFRELFNNMRSGVAIYNVENKGKKFYFKDFNRSAEKIEGLKKEDVIGKEIRKVFPGAKDMGIIKIFEKVYKSGESIYFPEAKIANKKGEVFYRSNFIYPIGKNTIVAIYRDITEEIKEKKRIEELSSRLEKIVDFVPSAIFTVDKDKKIITWNYEAELITGYKAQEILGKKCTDFAVWPCSDKCGLYSNDIKKPIKNKECTIKNKKGDIVWISKNVDYLRDAFGNITGGIESFVDITKEREKEDMINEKIEENEKIIKLLTGREVKMIELKEEVENLKQIIKDKDLENL